MRSRKSHTPSSLIGWASLLLATQLFSGCDNPACVFGPNGCQGTGAGGGVGDNEGLLSGAPQDGEWLSPSAPQITAFFPGNGAHEETPIALIFSESMDPAGIEDAFELIQESPEPGIPDFPGVPLSGALIGEGRLAILTPFALLPGGSYRVGIRDGAKLVDRTGQAYDPGVSNIVGNFSISENPDPTPQLLTMWPQDGSEEQSVMPQIVTVFDRAMDVGSVIAGGAFTVTVDGSPPANNPVPTVLSVTQLFGTVLTIPQVFTWRSFEADGEPALLGASAEVSLALAATIKSEDDELYVGSTTSFNTAPVNPPAGVAITSLPTDAFGVAHVEGTTPIEVTVTLQDPAVAGDLLTIYSYGASETPGSLSILNSEVSLADGAVEALLGEAELDFVDGAFGARFMDGDVHIAASVRRGSARSPVRLLDTDPTESGDQPAVLDTVPPVLVGLGPSGSQTTEYVSTTSGLTVVGVADEELASVEVSVLLDGIQHTNGALAPVIGANSAGAFVATTVDLGVVDPMTLPGDLSVTIYDRAQNAAIPLDLSWRQIGASGPGAALPGGGDVSVRVYDAVTHQAVSGALVFSHEVDTRETFLNGGVTDADGTALVPSAALGATVVTVDAAGYDLFSFHGVPTTRLDVPLQLSAANPARIFYTVTTDISVLADPSVSVNIADDRLLDGPLLEPISCTDSPFGVLCGFPSADLVSGRFGVATALATVDQDFFNWSAQSFLKVVQLDFPTAAAIPAEKLSTNFEIESLLDEIALDPEERAIEAPFVVFDTSGLLALDVGDLVGGSPRVIIEGRVAGLSQSATVGAGSAFDVGATWAILSAYAGAADGVSDSAEDLLGRWVTSGLIEDDLLLRVDVTDGDGNATGRRVRLSESGLGTSLIPSDVPVLIGPIFATGGSAFELEFADTLDDTEGGLYQVRLTDVSGRSWEVWRVDEPGIGGSITANVPEIELFGGQPLADGTLTAIVSLRGLPVADFDAESFLWGELSEQADTRAHTAAKTLQQP